MNTTHDTLPYTAREAMWLIDGGVSPEEACARVGIKVESLETTLARRGMADQRVGRAVMRVTNRDRRKAAA